MDVQRIYGCDPARGPHDYEALVEAEVGDDGVLRITSAVLIDPGRRQ